MSDQSSSRLEQVIALYLQAMDAGEEPDRASLLAEHGDLSDELRSFFQNHDVIRRSELESKSGVQPHKTNQKETSTLPELDGYTLVRELGAGGMGRVFLALHRRMERQVAIKFLPSELAQDDALIRRFHREAQVAARLAHPNIVTAHDAGEENDIHYLVMEYVDGADLGAIVRQMGPLKLDDAIRCIVQAGKGIEHAHENGVIHRDIKPGNLLLGHDGVVKVLDMGLARWSIATPDKTASDLSSSGMIMGTIDYLAPEQALNSKAADQRSDLYSLGCSLYFLHRGEVIHPRDSVVEKLLAHREADPPNLVDEDDDSSRELNEIFHKMISLKQADRYESVEEACAALQHWRGFADDELKLTISIRKPQITSPHASTVEKVRAQNVDTTRMGDSPQSASRSRVRWWVAASILSVMLIGLLSVPFFIRLWTPDGTLIVRCHIEGAFVEIDEQRRMTVTDPSGKDEYLFELRPGEHRVRVVMPDGTEIKSESVTVTSRKGTLFEVDAESILKTAGEGPRKGKPDPEPDVHTVAQDGSAEFDSIAKAVSHCQINDTVRITDDAVYVETALVSGANRYQGITIEFTGDARWKPGVAAPGVTPRCIHISKSDVTLRGVHFLMDSPGFAVIITDFVSNVRVEQCVFEATARGTAGISFEGSAVPANEPPLVVKESRFVGLQVGIRLSGSSDDNVKPVPIHDVLICNNHFENCVKATMLIGQLKNILYASNTVRDIGESGLSCQHLLIKSRNILVANNSFAECRSPVRVWEDGIPKVVVEFTNNMTLDSDAIDWLVIDSGGSPTAAKGYGDGAGVAKKWVFRNNFREGTASTAWRIPPSSSDRLVTKNEVLSRDPDHADFLRPGPSSPLATGGAGGELPTYVGAVPPSGTVRFDWEKYFTTVFKSDTKTTE